MGHPQALKDAPNIPDDIKTSVTAKIDALKKEKDSGSVDSIKSATEALSTEMQKIGEYMNKQAKNPNDQGPMPNEGDIKDAETK